MADRYWVGGTGTWNTTSTTNWSTGSGGSSGASVPTAADNVIFDSGSGTNPTITLGAAGLACLDITVSATTFTFTSTGTLTVSGSMSLASGTVWNATGTMTFNATSAVTILTNGTTLSCPVTLNGVGGTWALTSALTMGSTRTLTLTNGTLDLTNSGAGNYTLTTGRFSSTNSNTRSVTFGTANITLTDNNTTIWGISTATGWTISGTPTVNCTYSGSTGTRTITNTISIPEAHQINFNISAGSDTFIMGSAKNLNFTGFSGTLSNAARYIYGNLTFSSGMTITGGTGTISFFATSGTQQLTTAGKTLDFPITQNNPGATLRLEDNLTMGSTRIFQITGGTLDLNAKIAAIDTFNSSGTATRAITFNSGTLSISGTTTSAFNASGSGLTTSAGSGNGTITMTAATAKTFVGGGYTYAATLNQGGAGTLTVSGSNTLYDITATSVPSTITFIDGTTQTVTQFTASGTAGNLLTLDSLTPGSGYTLFDTSGTINISHCSIKDSIATGNAFWGAYISNGNINAGNNFGWRFSPVNQSSGFLSF